MNEMRRNDVEGSTTAGSKNKPRVAVVILNWNGSNFLLKFLPSVLASTYPNLEIVVADNASTDDSVTLLKEKFPKVTLWENKKNEGFAGGYNSALKQVDADVFVLLNSDVEVTPGWIEPIVALLESNPGIAACQPKVLSFHKRDTFEYAGASGGWIDRFGYPFARGRVFDDCETDTGQYNNAAPCFWATGAALFIRSEDFIKSGGFDVAFFAHQEEIDLCWRLHSMGREIYVQPASVVYHVGGGTLASSSPQKTYLNFRNNLFLLYKNLPKMKLLILPARMLLDLVAMMRMLMKGELKMARAILKAQFSFLGYVILGKVKRGVTETKGKNYDGMYRGLLVWAYFGMKKKRFSEIVGDKP